VTTLPAVLVAYHKAEKPIICEASIQPWRCEFWPLNKILQYNADYGVAEWAPGYLGFATSGGGEMFSFSPSGRIVCLPFIGMSLEEELLVGRTWQEFERMLRNAR
jgi:hypothetical protein